MNQATHPAGDSGLNDRRGPTHIGALVIGVRRPRGGQRRAMHYRFDAAAHTSQRRLIGEINRREENTGSFKCGATGRVSTQTPNLHTDCCEVTCNAAT